MQRINNIRIKSKQDLKDNIELIKFTSAGIIFLISFTDVITGRQNRRFCRDILTLLRVKPSRIFSTRSTLLFILKTEENRLTL